jgi:hypothetical protein
MRMFLVAMCDVFLLLYLTSISQNQGATQSKITLKDYKKLEALQQNAEKSQEDIKKEVLTLNREQLQLQEKLQKAEKKAEEAVLKASETVSKIELENKEALEKSRLAEEARLKAEESQKSSEEKANQALEEKKKAEEEATRARTSEELALAMAQRANLTASEVEKLALRTAEKAVLSEEKAERAQQNAAEQKQKLKSVLQPADKAFKENIGSRLAVAAVYIKRDGFLGDKETSLGSLGIPVSFGGKTVIFQALADLKLDKKFDDLLELKIQVDDKPIESVMLHPSKPIIGLVIGDAAPNATVLNADLSLMPTLIAVRNDATKKFADRIRGLDPVKFFFQRDRLIKGSGGELRHQAEGFRGTGDYGEVIMTGDQIVDLEGNLLGVAVDKNVIFTIGSPSEWESYPANGKTLHTLFSK